jgi:hypothetical protein
MGIVATVKAQRKCGSNFVLDGTEVGFSIEARLLSHPNMAPDLHTFVFSLQESSGDDGAGQVSSGAASRRCRRYDTLWLQHHSCMDIGACSSDAGAIQQFDTPQLPLNLLHLVADAPLQSKQCSTATHSSALYQPHHSLIRPDAR